MLRLLHATAAGESFTEVLRKQQTTLCDVSASVADAVLQIDAVSHQALAQHNAVKQELQIKKEEAQQALAALAGLCEDD